jgi:hypothetical protein
MHLLGSPLAHLLQRHRQISKGGAAGGGLRSALVHRGVQVARQVDGWSSGLQKCSS